mmetsp:Transcript_47040/g.106027  ORF Transcript_47040/g.106027 Transcript_47040/m.106027 type:complete len:209 (+) Transcript_47040:2058-2684(+)
MAHDVRVACDTTLQQTSLPKEVARPEASDFLWRRSWAGARLNVTLAQGENVEAVHRFALLEDCLAGLEVAPVRAFHHLRKLLVGDGSLRPPVRFSAPLLLQRLPPQGRREDREHVIELALVDGITQLCAHATQVLGRDVPLVVRVEELVSRTHHVERAAWLKNAHTLREGALKLASRGILARSHRILMQQRGHQKGSVDGSRSSLEGT